MAEHLIIGVDGGGTGCRVRAEWGGHTAEARGGPANVSDFAPAIGAITEALVEALSELHLPPSALARAYLHAGLAGVISPEVAEKTRAALPACARIAVTDDRATMIAGALGSGDGSLAALGTGSFLGRQEGGLARGLGGWGFRIGDQASGAWIGRRLFEETVLASEGFRPDTPLLSGTLAAFGSRAAMVSFAITASAADFARYAPKVVAAAPDPAAEALLAEAADYVARGLSVLGHREGDPLCLTGGFGPALKPWLPPALQAAVTPARGTALDGATALARRLAA